MSEQTIFQAMNKSLDGFFTKINTNKYLFGLCMIFLNIGSKYLITDLSSPFHKALLSSKFVRRLLIFTIVFIATRDIKISLILSFV